MGRLTTLLKIYSDYRNPDKFAEAIKRDFPVTYAVRSRVAKMLRRWGEFIEKGSSSEGAPAIF